ncbi:hypothetical protein LNI90_11880 [Tenacibaculum dicentrarchi]|nr:hypothetical protein [Tenacibaculum dicentrarchi]MCD8421261.1 hypothetical protein [Tenacibaculum dicentrarchi]MCD8452776.1 hypothetical protein [Tenacibaculum dicentrarchi]MCG8829096.1 hypothetical protein [Tenacibaculum dicentrarchi]WBX67980.1 hypothetical protein PG910_07550 [Tenacibaculum dicentrarchi]
MNELVEQYELSKEIHCVFNNIEPKIIGRVFKIIKGPSREYTWEISHYCRLDDEADCYTPSAPYGDSLEDGERALMAYMKRFEKAVDWRENKYF